MFCPECGTKNEEAAKFCENCGVRFPQDGNLTASEPVSAGQPEKPIQSEVHPSPVVSKKWITMN